MLSQCCFLGRTCSMHRPITPFTITGLAITTLLPINSTPSSGKRIPDLARPSGRGDGPSKLKGTACRGARRLLFVSFVDVSLDGPHAVGFLLRVAAVYCFSGARQRVADLACAGVRGDAAC